MVELSARQIVVLTVLIAIGLAEMFLFGYFYARDNARQSNVLPFRRRSK